MTQGKPVTAQQALTGTMQEFSQYFAGMQQQYWPKQPFGGFVDNTIPSTPAEFQQLKDAMGALYQRFPSTDKHASPAFAAVSMATQIAVSEDFAKKHPKKYSPVFPSSDAFTIDMRTVPQMPQTNVVLMSNNMCAHCAAPSERLQQSMNCNINNPHEVRLSQMNRMATGLHEFAHVADSDPNNKGTPVTVQRGGKPAQLDYSNYRESKADVFMTLMLVKEHGAEGRAVATAWLRDRYEPELKASHFTAGSLKAALALANRDPKLLARSSPLELMKMSDELAKANALTVAEAQALNVYREGQLIPDNPAFKKLFADYDAGVNAMPANREPLLVDMQKLNPLSKDPEWQKNADAAAAACRTTQPGPKPR